MVKILSIVCIDFVLHSHAHVRVFIAAPLVGAALAAIVFSFLAGSKNK